MIYIHDLTNFNKESLIALHSMRVPIHTYTNYSFYLSLSYPLMFSRSKLMSYANKSWTCPFAIGSTHVFGNVAGKVFVLINSYLFRCWHADFIALEMIIEGDGIHWFNHEFNRCKVILDDDNLDNLHKLCHIIVIITNVHNSATSIFGAVRAVTKALIGGCIFIYSRSARRISFEISCHYS